MLKLACNESGLGSGFLNWVSIAGGWAQGWLTLGMMGCAWCRGTGVGCGFQAWAGGAWETCCQLMGLAEASFEVEGYLLWLEVMGRVDEFLVRKSEYKFFDSAGEMYFVGNPLAESRSSYLLLSSYFVRLLSL